LNASVESIDDRADQWKREKISFSAASGPERMNAYLFLPANRHPPYQAVVFFPGANTLLEKSSQSLDPVQLDFIIKTCRGLLWPIYKGTFERSGGLTTHYPAMTSAYRDHVIAWSKDLRRSIDYLETRGDIDRERLAYVGLSMGGAIGPVL